MPRRRNCSPEPCEAQRWIFQARQADCRQVFAAAFNEPCRDLRGAEEGGAWIYSGESAIEDPDWLTVDAEAEAAA
jgi:hypothetical protein